MKRAVRGCLWGLVPLLLAGCGYPAVGPSGPVATVAQPTATPSQGLFTFDAGAGRTPVTFPNGLKIIDLVRGSGALVEPGDTVDVRYTGWLTDGTRFDSNVSGGPPLCAILNQSASSTSTCYVTIPGWTQGIPGMRVGGVRKLIIPPSLGYGSQGASPTIPPNATLIFVVKVVKILATPSPSPSPTPSPSASP
jgi:FKBP-type peptidyl-prolyl cis-trans isomerase FkpA